MTEGSHLDTEGEQLPEGLGIKKLHAEAGHIDVEFTAPPEIIAAMVEPLIEMLGDAPNYTESKVIVGKAGEPRYVLTVSRLNGRTPHELRREAEAEVERLRAQNKASSDEWTKRTAQLQKDYDRMKSLHAWAINSATRTHNDGRCPLCYKPHHQGQIAGHSQFAGALLALRAEGEALPDA